MSSSTGSTISSGGSDRGAAAVPAAAAPVVLSAPLAPGFRFHPTDEELVSYYLKRKVLGRPLRVDAIAEIDLYKCDPWDLPSRSILRSRDGEWYFFSPLDKKYANGSGKTNRATGRGYWKTTGKDRPVKRGGRMVGMKKTLVFHVGKAPKGERTNWVMHEYRLEGEYDNMLRQAGVAQYAYVVCRIFQKAGPGPQNGAQYGAPYVEEEWQDDDDFDANVMLPVTLPPPVAPDTRRAAAAAVAAVPAPPADEDFKNFLQDEGVSSKGSVGSLLVQNDKNDINHVDYVCDDVEKSVLESHRAYDFPMENYIPPEGFRTDDYLELKDFMDPVDVYLAAHQGTNPADADIEASTDMFGQNSHSPAASNMVDFPYIADEEAELMQADPMSSHNFSYEIDGALNFSLEEYLLDEEASNELLYSNASNQMDAIGESSTIGNPSSQNLKTTEPSSVDTFDDIAAYFDAPEDNLECLYLDSSTTASSWSNSKLPSKDDVVALQMNQQSDIGGGNWSRASKTEPTVVSQADIENFDVYARDGSSDGSSSKNTIAKRLWSMLDSVSAPPALAAEAPLAAKHMVIDPAAWMKANGLTLEGNGKAADYSKPSKDRASIFGPCFRIHHRVASWMARNGCSVCFSVLILAASVNIGRCYSRLCFM